MKLIKITSKVFYAEVEIMTLQLKVPKIACSACANTIAQAVKTIDPAAVVEADIKTKLVTIQSVKPENEVRKAIASVGYPAL
ncbi:heavy-metal-associated domain-containing protein [Microcoleus sp.]|uniref:heavy-metal-associated domain-containing protein n=2 Tax=Microcoleus sp. TaxID=44472 RepID=UPI003524961D